MMGQSPVMRLVSCLVGKLSRVKYVATGFNSYRESRPGCQYSRHAEVDAMLKLDRLYSSKRRRNRRHNNKHKKFIDLLVIRVNKNGELRDSRPCEKCLELLSRMRCFKVKNIYYSTNNNEIVVEKFSDLYEKKSQYLTRRFHEDNFGFKKPRS